MQSEHNLTCSDSLSACCELLGEAELSRNPESCCIHVQEHIQQLLLQHIHCSDPCRGCNFLIWVGLCTSITHSSDPALEPQRGLHTFFFLENGDQDTVSSSGKRKGSHSTVFSEKLCLHEEVSTYRSLCMPQWLEYPGLSPQPGPRALVRHKPYSSTNLMEILFFSTLTKSISSKDSN